MYLGFAEDPVAFLNIIIASQVSNTSLGATAAQQLHGNTARINQV
jgi:hypothetical protein